MKKPSITLLLLLAVVMLTAACAPTMRKVGVEDEASAEKIVRINAISDHRRRNEYAELTALLAATVGQKDHDPASEFRVLNELADIYSNNLMDLEKAVEMDQKLKVMGPQAGQARLLPAHTAANNQVLADNGYLDRYYHTSAGEVMQNASVRLSANLSLLDGNEPASSGRHSLEFLKAFTAQVREDLQATQKGSPEYCRLLSRLMRGEYEILRYHPSGHAKADAAAHFLDGSLSLAQVDYSEINFLALARYLQHAYAQTRNPTLGDLSVEALYKPYRNLRATDRRWVYSKLINEHLNRLVQTAFEAGSYTDLLYYSSLNKSRMLLEERLAYSTRPGLTALGDIGTDDDIPHTASGLPQRVWFADLLAGTVSHLDFYVSGKYAPRSTSGHAVRRSGAGTPTMRDFGVADVSRPDEEFQDDALYLIHIAHGRISMARRVSGKAIQSLKTLVSEAYSQTSDPKRGEPARPIDFFQQLTREQHFPPTISVSPDKWLARQPLDLYLGAQTIRSVNFFTTARGRTIGTLSVTGYFNPTLDLPGAEQEAEAISAVMPGARIFKREAATIAALEAAQKASIIHLSMHGAFNDDDPKNSKLYFAGAKRGLGKDDPNALYARDMASHPALSDRELVFAAACQTGLSKADRANENELMGILRSLTANRNKNVILSLWKVDDAATRDFVRSFYGNLAATRDVAASFHKAQDEIRARYKKPYYWSAFYLSQAR